MELLGHQYTDPQTLWLGDRKKVVIFAGVILEVIRDTADQKGVHYGYKDFKIFRAGELIEVKSVWFNFYGTYVRTEQEGHTHDIKISDLKLAPPIPKKSVVAIIMDGDKILLLKRHPYDRTLPNKYCLAGGKVDEGETEETALKREVFEETGLTVDICRFISESNGEFKNFSMKFYQAFCTNNVRNVTISDEHESFRFFTKEEIENSTEIADVTKKHLMQFLNG